MAAGLLGPLVGFFIAIQVTRINQRYRSTETCNRLYSILLAEIFGHQISLIRTFDFSLPAWLTRATKTSWTKKDFNPETLATYYFDEFFSSLIDSPLLTLIAGHYRNVKRFNSLTDELNDAFKKDGAISPDDSLPHHFIDAIRDVFKSMKALTDRLLPDRRVRKYLLPSQLLAIDEYNICEEQVTLLCGLSIRKFRELAAWEAILLGESTETMEIPDFFRQNIQTWRRFLMAARNVKS